MKFRLFSAVDGLLRTRVSKTFAEKSGRIQKKEKQEENDIPGCLLIFDYPFRAYLFFHAENQRPTGRVVISISSALWVESFVPRETKRLAALGGWREYTRKSGNLKKSLRSRYALPTFATLSDFRFATGGVLASLLRSR